MSVFNSRSTTTFLLVLFLFNHLRVTKVLAFGFEQAGASCSSNEYCPGGWSVLRRSADYSAHTCNPGVKERSKCPKPYMCVAAKCGISFCCANDKMLAKLREEESAQRDMAEDAEEERVSELNGTTIIEVRENATRKNAKKSYDEVGKERDL